MEHLPDKFSFMMSDSENTPMLSDIEQCEYEIDCMLDKESDSNQRLEHLDRLWEARRHLIVEKLEAIRQQRTAKEHALDILLNPPTDELPPPGPTCLRWVDGSFFSGLCMLVIVLNLITMIFEMMSSKYAAELWIYDQFFLCFYVVELVLKWTLYRCGFLIGKISIVWWNWLDLVIVISGLIDQWLQPLLKASGLLRSDGQQHVSTSGLRVLRLLRLVRVVRVLKIVRIFLAADLSWTEAPWFQSFITGVIALNAVTLGVELDVEWSGWVWIEETMLLIYIFELSVRVKRFSWNFFFNEDWAWNNLDFIIVMGGVIEMWMTPLYMTIYSLLTGTSIAREHHTTFLPLLRLLRLLRILRLIRVLKGLKPLYKLSLGVVEAMQAMQWVVVMTVILLYASSILFTSLVGHGMVGVTLPSQSRALFGSVLQSMFLLFRVMNGDQTPMGPLLHSYQIKILFILFMVISNWMVLAILSAVVSENMISATNEFMRAERKEDENEQKKKSSERLISLFNEIDKDGDSTIDEAEFHALLADKGLCDEFCDAAGLTVADLTDLFTFLSHEASDGRWAIDYQSFVSKLQLEGKGACERSVFRLEQEMRHIETRIDSKLECMREEVRGYNTHHGSGSIEWHQVPDSQRQIRNRHPGSKRNHSDDRAPSLCTLPTISPFDLKRE